jgi:hypothetical protein
MRFMFPLPKIILQGLEIRNKSLFVERCTATIENELSLPAIMVFRNRNMPAREGQVQLHSQLRSQPRSWLHGQE